ncbi:hypothetical protein ACLOJK_007060 [Asimina triloba]
MTCPHMQDPSLGITSPNDRINSHALPKGPECGTFLVTSDEQRRKRSPPPAPDSLVSQGSSPTRLRPDPVATNTRIAAGQPTCPHKGLDEPL